MDEHPDIYPDDPYGGSAKKDNVSDDDSPIENFLARFSQGGGGKKKLPPASGGGDDGGRTTKKRACCACLSSTI